MSKKVIVKTFIHLLDRKGWEHIEEYPGEFKGMSYLIPRRINWKDAVPLENVPDPLDGSLKYYHFDLDDQQEEHVYENYYFRRLYFSER